MKSFDKINKHYDELLSGTNKTLTIQKVLNECNEHLIYVNEKVKKYVNMFNELMIQVLDLLINEFPNNPKFRIYKTIIQNYLKQNGECQPLSLFIFNVYVNEEYKDAILRGDDSIFLKTDYTDGYEDDELRLDIISELKKCWLNMTKSSKEYVIDVFKTLIEICAEYIIDSNNRTRLLKMAQELDNMDKLK